MLPEGRDYGLARASAGRCTAHLAAQRTRASPGGLLAGEACLLSVGDEVAAPFDLSQNPVALDELGKAGEECVAGFAIASRNNNRQAA
jgi:hypothetical protein